MDFVRVIRGTIFLFINFFLEIFKLFLDWEFFLFEFFDFFLHTFLINLKLLLKLKKIRKKVLWYVVWLNFIIFEGYFHSFDNQHRWLCYFSPCHKFPWNFYHYYFDSTLAFFSFIQLNVRRLFSSNSLFTKILHLLKEV